MLRRVWLTSLSAVAGLAFGAAAASAGEVVVVPLPPRAPCPPLVSVKAGDPARPVVSVNIPGLLRLEVGRTGLLRRRLGVPVLAPPPPAPVPLPALAPPMPPIEGELPAPRLLAPAVNAPVLVPTPAEFGAGFQPRPGRYEVALLHPDTGRPVLVRFELPPGNPKVRVEKRELEFDYGKYEVEIRFHRNGTVRVEYD